MYQLSSDSVKPKNAFAARPRVCLLTSTLPMWVQTKQNWTKKPTKRSNYKWQYSENKVLIALKLQSQRISNQYCLFFIKSFWEKSKLFLKTCFNPFFNERKSSPIHTLFKNFTKFDEGFCSSLLGENFTYPLIVAHF